MAIQISGTTVIDNSRNLVNIANATSSAATANTYVIRDANGSICVTGLVGFIGLSPLGSFGEGGYLICKSSGTAWIVAPSSSEVSRNWYSRNDASTRAQQVSGCTGWFVPNLSQLQNPGYTCRTYWDSYSSQVYWSTSSSYDTICGGRVCFPTGSTGYSNKTATFCVRAFRCVIY